MLRAKDGQEDGEAQIAQDYDLVETSGRQDLSLRGPPRGSHLVPVFPCLSHDLGGHGQLHRPVKYCERRHEDMKKSTWFSG
jgi:hypothetical protein